ncbi:MAG: hypothetical protein QHJ73_05095, partial [Armatimonadota bacterium]|nr:hypothetical protein [Armatimonadota bacterium]
MTKAHTPSGTRVVKRSDRAFIEGLATSVLELRDGRSTLFRGDYAYYLAKSAALADAAGASAPSRQI